ASSGGRHYGHYKAGSDTGIFKVSATAHPGGKAANATVTVTAVPVASVLVTPAVASLPVGGTVQLSATTNDSAGNVLTGRTVTWASRNTAVAAASGSGFVAAGGAAVAVTPAVASLPVGGTVQLSATTKDSVGNVLTGRAVTWASSNTPAAAVSGSGFVTAVAAGVATITATSEGKSGIATVTVTASSGGGPITDPGFVLDRKSTRLNSSHGSISYAVFCLKKKQRIS